MALNNNNNNTVVLMIIFSHSLSLSLPRAHIDTFSSDEEAAAEEEEALSLDLHLDGLPMYTRLLLLLLLW